MTPRSTAPERRQEVLVAALHEFARTGYHATSVATIARSAGISEGYVFSLFGSKQSLFIATLEHCFDRVLAAIDDAADVAPTRHPAAVLRSMAGTYAHLIVERDLLMIQVHALAAANEPPIQAAYLRLQAGLVDLVRTRSRASDSAVQEFFARGQLCHFVTALEITADQPQPPPTDPDYWKVVLASGIRHYPAT